MIALVSDKTGALQCYLAIKSDRVRFYNNLMRLLETGYAGMVLQMRESNTAARALYAGFGFQEMRGCRYADGGRGQVLGCEF